MTTTDPIGLDIRRMVAALVRSGLEHPDVERFRLDAWRLVFANGSYVALWSDGRPIAVFDEDTVALAVGLLRARREARRAQLN
ncbi:MAG: hypothetical protein HYX57_01980 [Chloroflexi bacterium]|nr:hypothetical protein [Chloroflexota bacterium]